MMKNPHIFSIFSIIIYGLGFLLFLEWLYPLKEFGEMTNINVFIIYAIFCFLISLFQVNWWLSALMKGSGLLLIINQLYFVSPFLSISWLQELSLEIEINFRLIMNQHWFHLSDSFRTLLCLLLIWLMSYLIYYWFVSMKRIFIFIMLTFIYLLLLDTFTLYDGRLSIIRLFFIAFIALGLTHMLKVLAESSFTSLSRSKIFGWIFSIVMIVLVSASLGYFAPKYDPQWPDPVPLIMNYTSENGFIDSPKRIVGYSEDDSQLGGSFHVDNTPVFHVMAEQRHYWRIETKDVYTGKGWVASTEPNFEPLDNGMVSLQTFSEDIETKQAEVLVEYQNKVEMSKLGYPYGLSLVEGNESDSLQIDYFTGSITKQAGDPFIKDTFNMTYNYPMYDLNMLRESKRYYPPEILEQYTQVPDTLPNRVYELVQEITAFEYTRYDKVKAIEQYFHRHGFKYEITDIPYPQEDQDYVDHFLFDLQRGYCDHFSTSMVVMLRTLNIPARWVKGFTGGQEIDHPGSLPNGYQYYEITNANAHSWVEVYFPEVGWVPFEPTQGFVNPTTFYETLEDIEEVIETDPLEIDEGIEEENREPTGSERGETNVTPENKQDNNVTTTPSHAYWIYIIIGVVGLSVVIVVYRLRYRIKTIYLAKSLQKQSDFYTFDQAYHHLLSLLSHHDLARAPDQTLREYALVVDEKYGTKLMQRLTKDYEQMLYNNKTNKKITIEQIETWRQMIQRIQGNK